MNEQRAHAARDAVLEAVAEMLSASIADDVAEGNLAAMLEAGAGEVVVSIEIPSMTIRAVLHRGLDAAQIFEVRGHANHGVQ